MPMPMEDSLSDIFMALLLILAVLAISGMAIVVSLVRIAFALEALK